MQTPSDSVKRACRTIAAACVLSTFMVEYAWAYLDPATGWMIVQGIIAAIAAAFVAVGSYWTRFKTWLGRGRKATANKEEAEGVTQRQD
jgi:hypothetical protein